MLPNFLNESYKHDVFISYRCTPRGIYWVSNYFKPVLEEELGHCLGRQARIFLDKEDIKVGFQWPDTLKNALASSACIVPVLCGQYFNSEWCSREFAIMYNRAQKYSKSTDGELHRLILPILVRDGNHLPDHVSKIQHLPFNDFYTACESFKTSPDYRIFENKVKLLAENLFEALKSIPDLDPEWTKPNWTTEVDVSTFYSVSKTTLIENPVLR